MITPIILILLRKDSIDPGVRFLIVIVVIIIIIIIGAVNKTGGNSTSNRQSRISYTPTTPKYTAPTYTAPVRDPNLWYGEMGCHNCGYRWQSRKKTPPASCPSCRSKNISIIIGNKPFVRFKPQSQSYSSPEPPKPTTNSQNPYEVLQVPTSASMDEITAAYKQMAQLYHPDKVASLAPEFREIAERRMKEINAAYAALKAKGQTQAIKPPNANRSNKPDEQYPDELFNEALIIVTDMGRASPSVLQRRLAIGYGRAAKILEQMEHQGLIGPPDGVKPRKVLQAAYQLREQKGQNHTQENTATSEAVRTLSANDLFSPDFMKSYTGFDSIDSLFDGSGFKIEDSQDIEGIPQEQWDAFIYKHTKFTSWQQMKKFALDEYCHQHGIKGRLKESKPA